MRRRNETAFDDMRVGFIGLGRMGAPMAARIAAAGHDVVGYDISAERRSQTSSGIPMVDSPAAVAADVDVVVTSLPGPAEVADVVRGTNGLMASIKRDAVLVETSTISPQLSRALARDLAAQSVSYLDAPISGGAHGARDGTLVVMVGGEAQALDLVRPVLSCFAKDIFHLGPVGAGNVMKLVIQAIFLSQMAGFLEAVSMGERSGIALDTQLRIVAASSAHHPAIGTRYEKLRSGDLKPMFEVGSAVKDLSLAEDLWRELEGSYPILSSALSDYRGAVDSGLSAADLIAVRNWLNEARR
jgi:3-hydroxyisobutyrate dehydrogenase-like beta-hydroxyacid dehydrogenase